jgi:hypothetical protein
MSVEPSSCAAFGQHSHVTIIGEQSSHRIGQKRLHKMLLHGRPIGLLTCRFDVAAESRA